MKKITERDPKSQLLSPPSPKNSVSSSSSSDFEFTVSISPRKSSTALCPADELFCNGQLLPLHHSRRVSSVRRTLLSSSSTSSSSDSTTTATSRDSTGSSNDSRSSSSNSDSSRPSLVAEDDDLKRPDGGNLRRLDNQMKKSKHFSLSRFSSVFRKEPKNHGEVNNEFRARGKGIGSTAKEMIKKYFKKVQKKMGKGNPSAALPPELGKDSQLTAGKSEEAGRFSTSFSGNLRYPRGRTSFLPSCPSSTRSSPSHSGVLRRRGVHSMSSSSIGGYGSMYCAADTSSMEELQSSIQGAIAHCKNSLIQNKNTIKDNGNDNF